MLQKRVGLVSNFLIGNSLSIGPLLIKTILAGILVAIIPCVAQAQANADRSAGVSAYNASSSSKCEVSTAGSPFIPVDSWIYPAILRLYSLGYVNGVYLGMRPWTRLSVGHMLENVGRTIDEARSYGEPTISEAQSIYKALSRELKFDTKELCLQNDGLVHFESAYSALRGISGTPLHDSFHLGSSVVNDYGRPYEGGINGYFGASGYASSGRFALYVRGELQVSPSATGYSTELARQLALIDGTTTYFNSRNLLPVSLQTTIPVGPIDVKSHVRLMEAYVSAQYFNHVFSFGKQDEWLGPGLGGSMAYSNNAENLYGFHINRIEPLYIPLLSRITGPFRYEFLVGPSRGHVYPMHPWVHLEKISLRPTRNLELGFERTVIWGGKDHAPITMHTFLKSFFSLSAPSAAVKFSSDDPGARFGAFDFSYRLPLMRNWLTLYADSEVHDDVSPIDAPRRASWRPGLFLSHLPSVPKLDVRAEAAYTDPPITNSQGGRFMYWEVVQRQGYTNQGQIFGDWVGREGKGGQGWITYHLSGSEWLQAYVRNHKVAKDFVPGGTTLNAIGFQAVKRIGRDLEITGDFTLQNWKAPVYLQGKQTVTSTTIQLKWLPNRKINF